MKISQGLGQYISEHLHNSGTDLQRNDTGAKQGPPIELHM